MNQPKSRVAKKGLVYRYPRLFVIVTSTVCALTLFSKPIYDILFSSEIISIEELRQTDKSKSGKE